MINYLVNLKATSSLDTIREAYKHDCVDCGVLGDVEDVEIELVVRPHLRDMNGFLMMRHTHKTILPWFAQSLKSAEMIFAHVEVVRSIKKVV